MHDDDLTAMKRRVEHLISIAAGGRIRAEDLRDHQTDLRRIGLDSLGYLNLLEGLERSFGVTIDLDREADHSFLHTIDNIVNFLVSRRGKAA